ncbi:AMP-binding protein [Micrococcus cohnii]|uniref:Propionyl-CoA synthetase n=1 Tax=Micrococcus cohnii TaxID=993416 RepID=A0A7W7M3A7_9MICC|nr:AMP-binding protein [Micrococcus cohnii]MBB4735466.1 propionyl-CoA synthetase [Micrococcus cohnii]
MDTTSRTDASTSYVEAHRASLQDRDRFWLDAARAVDWSVAPTRAVDDSDAPLYRWFPDGVLNTAHNCLDRHVVAGRGDRLALIHDSAVTGTVTGYTYDELTAEVAALAGALAGAGVGKGDRVLIYLPMIPQAPIAMLACARLGAVHSVVFGGFAPKELAARIDDATPDVVLTASGGIEPKRRVEYLPAVAEALETAEHPVRTVFVHHREGFESALADVADRGSADWVDWAETVEAAEPAGCVDVSATDPLYVLYTSGTTGRPKGVVRDNGGHAVALTWTMENIYDVGPGQVMCTASDVGWVVGHSYIVYGPLLAGATTVLYEGKPVGTPDAGAFWRLVAEHGVRSFFTAPTALRAIRKADPDGELMRGHDLSCLKHFYAAGERLEPETQKWAESLLGMDVIDHWWQTETGWAIAANPVGLEPLPVKTGSSCVPSPGYEVVVLDGTGEPVPAGEEGNIAVRLPLPPGALTTLWGDDQRYIDSYLSAFEGHYATGDSGLIDEDGYVFVLGRTDDVINVSGHRLSTGTLEAALAAHPRVAECAVIGVSDEMKGQRPAGYVVLTSDQAAPAVGGEDESALLDELRLIVRKTVGPVADFKDVVIVEALPKTRSGKILRKTMRQMADGDEVTVPSTIEDAAALESLRARIGASVRHGSVGAES